jgi:hypothetical protein
VKSLLGQVNPGRFCQLLEVCGGALCRVPKLKFAASQNGNKSVPAYGQICTVNTEARQRLRNTVKICSTSVILYTVNIHKRAG